MLLPSTAFSFCSISVHCVELVDVTSNVSIKMGSVQANVKVIFYRNKFMLYDYINDI